MHVIVYWSTIVNCIASVQMIVVVIAQFHGDATASVYAHIATECARSAAIDSSNNNNNNNSWRALMHKVQLKCTHDDHIAPGHWRHTLAQCVDVQTRLEEMAAVHCIHVYTDEDEAHELDCMRRSLCVNDQALSEAISDYQYATYSLKEMRRFTDDAEFTVAYQKYTYPNGKSGFFASALERLDACDAEQAWTNHRLHTTLAAKVGTVSRCKFEYT